MATAGVRDGGKTIIELENPPASLRSAVWQHFAFPVIYVNNERVVDKKHTVCRLCYTRVPYAPSGNTTNMAGHIRRHHKQIHLWTDLPGKRATLPSPGMRWRFAGEENIF